MKQLTIISGKGGTGKTTITSAFACLSGDSVLADCDVDAADMHLLLQPQVTGTFEFYGLDMASIDLNRCTGCGECIDHCRFNAIGEDLIVDTCRCEGCGVCEYICPTNAVEMLKWTSGEAFESMTRFGPMAHAKLKVGEEAGGKLVAVVREHARTLAHRYGKDLVIIDGPPGTGCSVIAAITGVDMVLVVTEPSLSGIHDLERVLDVAAYFNIPALVCINKFDVNEENSCYIERYCRENEVPVVGKLPYDPSPTQAMIEEETVIEYCDNEFSRGIADMWENVREKMGL